MAGLVVDQLALPYSAELVPAGASRRNAARVITAAPVQALWSAPIGAMHRPIQFWTTVIAVRALKITTPIGATYRIHAPG